MRPLILIILLLILAAAGFWRHTQQQANSKADLNNTNTADLITTENDIANEKRPLQQVISAGKPQPKDPHHTSKTKPAPTVSIDDLNLDLPVTVNPTTPALTLPNNKTLILEPKKYRPSSVIIGGGIDWDDEENKAKGANITITIPTG